MPEGAGTHVCHFYSTIAEAGPHLRSFLRQGLEERDRILCFAPTRELAILEALIRDQLEPTDTPAGQLRFLAHQDVLPPTGSFDPEFLFARFERECKAARHDGFNGLRIIQDLTGLAPPDDPHRLLIYEAGIEAACPHSVACFCLYSQKQADSDLLLDLLSLHPLAAVGGNICENPYYLPPMQGKTSGEAAAVLRHRLKSIDPTQRRRTGRDGTPTRLLSWGKISQWLTGRKKPAPEEETQQRYLAELLLVSREITTTTRLEKLYQKVMDLALDLLELDFSTLMLLSSDRTRLTIEACLGFPENLRGHFHLTSGEGLSTYVVKTAKPATVLDFRQENRFSVPPLVQENGITSAVSAPMILEGEVFGVLIGHTRQKRRFNGQEISLFQFLANQAGLAIRNSQNLKKLQESEDKYRKLIETANDAIIMYEAASGIIMDFNARAREMTGLAGRALAGRHYLDLHPAEEADTYAALFQRIIDQGKALAENLVIRRPDGRRLPVDISASLSQTRTGPLVQIIFRDITQRQQAEEALAAEKERLAVTLSSIGDGVIATNGDGLVSLMNRRAETLTGWQQEKALNQPLNRIFRIYDEKTRLPLEDSVTTVLETGQVVERDRHILLIAEDGTERIIAESGAPIRDRQQQIVGVVLVFRDNTAARQLEKEFLRAQKLEAVGILAGGIAHDFNNILFAILGYAQLSLVETPEESPIHQNLREIVNSGKRAAELVRQILTFSRQTEQERKPMQLVPVLKETVKLLRGTLPTTINIRQKFENPGRPILADITQIHQVIMNLCTNAYHAMREHGGELTLEVAETVVTEQTAARYPGLQPGQYARLTIGDTGHGMSKQTLDQIFDPFFTTKEPGEGTGLGLSTVHGIVMNHEGSITVDSTPGAGTVFHVYFPLLQGDLPGACPQFPEPATAAGIKARVLFVDDEELIVQMGKRMLTLLGCEVIACTSSTEALKRFEDDSTGFDLVITDQTMPRLTGVELSRKILRRRPEQKIILLTGYSSVIDEKQARSLGILAFVLKPLTLNQLTKAICQALGRPGAGAAASN